MQSILWVAAPVLSSHRILLSPGAVSKSIRQICDKMDLGMMQDWEEGDGDYLAPELLQEASPTPAADIYSLGATLYECATGAG